MNAKQAKSTGYARDKQTGIIWPYTYIGFRPPQRYCYIQIFRNGAYHLDLAKGYEPSSLSEYREQNEQYRYHEDERSKPVKEDWISQSKIDKSE